MTVRFLTAYPPYVVGNSETLDAATEAALIAKGIATADLTNAVAYVAPAVRATGTWIPLTRNKTIEPPDDDKCYAPLTAITITFPAGLIPRPTVCIMPPPTGVVSVTTSAGTVTRSRANNPGGFVVAAYQDADGYGVSGS